MFASTPSGGEDGPRRRHPRNRTVVLADPVLPVFLLLQGLGGGLPWEEALHPEGSVRRTLLAVVQGPSQLAQSLPGGVPGW